MSDHNHEANKEALAARYTDLLSEQADAEELQLIGDLETLYASARVPAQLLAQGWPGLEKPGRPQGSPLPYTKIPHDVEVGVTAIPAKRRAATAQQRRWINRLNALAAVLIAALLVSSLVIVTHVARRPQPGNGNGNTNSSQCIIPQTRTDHSTLWLSFLHMTSVTTGWGAGTDETVTGLARLLHTIDGGRSWQNVTPAQPDFPSTISSQKTVHLSTSYFLNGCSAWMVIVRAENGPALLFHTSNGGLTWQESRLPGNQIRGIDFIDAHVGWLTVDVLKNGIFDEEDIYHTVDGGRTWHKIVNTAFPFANADNSLTFINPETGWITGALSINNSPRLYITHDGGQTWNQQVLPLPPGASFSDGTVVWPPHFFSASDGILPVSFWSDDGIDVYVTHNGGKSWQSTSLLHISMSPTLDTAAPTPNPDFIDVNHGWVSGWRDNLLYTTDDGGKHWTKIVPQPNTPDIARVTYDFVTDKIGWAIRDFSSKTHVAIPPVLYKTEDGGRTWTPAAA